MKFKQTTNLSQKAISAVIVAAMATGNVAPVLAATPGSMTRAAVTVDPTKPSGGTYDGTTDYLSSVTPTGSENPRGNP